MGLNSLVELRYGRFCSGDLFKLQLEHESMVFRNPAAKGFSEFR